MEINRVTIGKKTLEPLQQPSNFDKKEITIEKQKNAISFAIDHHIVTKGEQIGIILSNVHDGEVVVHTILNELKSVLQLLQQLPNLLEEKNGQNEQMYQEILKNVQELVKNIHVRQIPLLDGTYDFIELPVSFLQHGKQMMIPLLDVVALTHMLRQDFSKIEMVIHTITTYMAKVSNDSVSHAVTQERDVGTLRALAEMSMTQLSQQMKQLVKEHKWPIAIFFLLICVICIYVVQR
ncbi:hypothetical protein [Bacillus sp. BP-3]|uniref:hypothetical protein n=1 Tax=Bacillus sp. BP-3 TaxID=3022773 RepID=UPI00232B8DEB|nr:hypothetical protein [Bacillus sp. BP-3]MDC2865742.1 hypothetical protein [Bacillus sp. BP-3]